MKRIFSTAPELATQVSTPAWTAPVAVLTPLFGSVSSTGTLAADSTSAWAKRPFVVCTVTRKVPPRGAVKVKKSRSSWLAEVPCSRAEPVVLKLKKSAWPCVSFGSLSVTLLAPPGGGDVPTPQKVAWARGARLTAAHFHALERWAEQLVGFALGLAGRRGLARPPGESGRRAFAQAEGTPRKFQ